MWNYWRVPLACCMGFETRSRERGCPHLSSACNLCNIAAVPVSHRRQLPGKGGRAAFTRPGSPRRAGAHTSRSPPLGSRRLGAPRSGPWTARRLPWHSGMGQQTSGPGAGVAIPPARPGPSRRENAQQQTGTSLCFHPFHAIPPSFQRTGSRAFACPCSAEIKPLTSLQAKD